MTTKNMIDWKQCPECFKWFKRHPREGRAHFARVRFCSKKCRLAWQKAGKGRVRAKHLPGGKKCSVEGCENFIPPGHRFLCDYHYRNSDVLEMQDMLEESYNVTLRRHFYCGTGLPQDGPVPNTTKVLSADEYTQEELEYYLEYGELPERREAI